VARQVMRLEHIVANLLCVSDLSRQRRETTALVVETVRARRANGGERDFGAFEGGDVAVRVEIQRRGADQLEYT